MGAASDCAHHPYLSLYLPHNQAHYGVDEDEEWWPGRVLGVHSQGAHAGLFDVLYDDGELQPNLPSP